MAHVQTWLSVHTYSSLWLINRLLVLHPLANCCPFGTKATWKHSGVIMYGFITVSKCNAASQKEQTCSITFNSRTCNLSPMSTLSTILQKRSSFLCPTLKSSTSHQNNQNFSLNHSVNIHITDITLFCLDFLQVWRKIRAHFLHISITMSVWPYWANRDRERQRGF